MSTLTIVGRPKYVSDSTAVKIFNSLLIFSVTLTLVLGLRKRLDFALLTSYPEPPQ